MTHIHHNGAYFHARTTPNRTRIEQLEKDLDSLRDTMLEVEAQIGRTADFLEGLLRDPGATLDAKSIFAYQASLEFRLQNMQRLEGAINASLDALSGWDSRRETFRDSRR